MLLQSIIQQSEAAKEFEAQPAFNWNAPTNGDYQPLTVHKVDLFTPTTENDKTYNHHPFVIEHGGKIHYLHSTTDANEEHPGMYVRYTTTDLDLSNQQPYQVIFESQDDPSKDYSLGGRVCVPSGFAIVNSELFALTDVNDRGTGDEPKPRYKIGELARKVNSDGSFGTIYWIENGNGSLTAPAPISGFPSYTFNASLRNSIRGYFLNNPEKRTDWYYSVPTTDPLYTRGVFTQGYLSEPRVIRLPSTQYLKIWRLIDTAVTRKVVQTSTDAFQWNEPYFSEIPDSPSRTMVLTLKNKVVAIIGNNEGGAVRSPLFLALSTDGLTYDSDNIYNIDVETSGADFTGLHKNIGAQYPHATELSNGKICVVYSINKESIRAAIFEVPQII